MPRCFLATQSRSPCNGSSDNTQNSISACSRETSARIGVRYQRPPNKAETEDTSHEFKQQYCKTHFKCYFRTAQSVSLATGQTAEESGFDFRQSKEIVPLLRNFRTSSEAHPAYYSMGTQVSSSGLNRPGREADLRSTHTSQLIEDRDNFTWNGTLCNTSHDVRRGETSLGKSVMFP